MPFTKYSKKQKKIAKLTPPKNAITRSDFKKLRKQKTKKRG
tara:strand:- start:4525 stop:4647 length:123 start_codon:yes stop_codon:yes gene_type:complete